MTKFFIYFETSTGIDFFLSKRGDTYYPYGIEVNSHDCTINCQLYEFMNPHLSGQSVKPLVQTMIRRSQTYRVRGKTILVLNLGVKSKRFILDRAKQDKIKVVYKYIVVYHFLYA